eukprot:CAMPEP_0119035552 /NCGR_PEP_ID=MMETSP1177-20130426/2615_1 /TAXON_ID=2985 /ORGANISM="Ochromonas sp, Strain CCMP1899" /LENGTH=858 /DNA_ID=CAMNT_0006993965 /DNA_START=124 /DNA_END=2700 /DNA_ORIENTATION=+
MTSFSGNLEETAYNQQSFNDARRLRLQQVRQQEKLISSSRCNAYRKLIDDRKNIKKTSLKEKLISQRKNQHDNLALAWQKALVDTGNAHRTAAQVTETKEVFNDEEWRLEKQREIASIQRGRDAAVLRNNKNRLQEQEDADRLEIGTLRKATIASDREDARATAEAKVAKIDQQIFLKKLLALQTCDSRRSSNVVKLTRQSALKIQDRGSVVAGTNIVRHGKQYNDESLIVNYSDDAERSALKKQWTTVMKEMLHRKIIGSRAFFARKTIAMKQQAGRLEAELLILSLADKAVCRASKARNVASVKTIPQGVDSNAFEKEFLSSTKKAVTTYSNTAPSSSLRAQSDNMNTEIDMKSTIRQSREPLKWEEEQTIQKSQSKVGSLRGHSDDINTEIDTDLLKSTLRQSREPLKWEEEQTVQKSRFKEGSLNRASKEGSINRASKEGSINRAPLNHPLGRNSMSKSIDKSPLLWTIPSESDEPNYTTEKIDQACVQSPLVNNVSNINNIESRSLVIDVPDLNSESAANSEEDSLFDSIRSESNGPFSSAVRSNRRGLETDLSTSTAATLEARHDRYNQPLISQEEYKEPLISQEEYKQPLIPQKESQGTAFPLMERNERKVSQYLEEDSSMREEDSSVREEDSSVRRSDDDSSKSLSSSITEHPVDISYSMRDKNNLEDQEDRKSFALTVRMQRTKAGSGSSGEVNDAISMDSFEAVFEDESDDELQSEKSISIHDIRGMHDESRSSDSLPISPSDIHSPRSDRDGEGEDNISAITWPDMPSKKEVAISPQPYESKYLMRNEAAGKGRVSETDLKSPDISLYDRLRESDSIDEGGLLQELDELSISWARRKKNLEEKGRYS